MVGGLSDRGDGWCDRRVMGCVDPLLPKAGVLPDEVHRGCEAFAAGLQAFVTSLLPAHGILPASVAKYVAVPTDVAD